MLQYSIIPCMTMYSLHAVAWTIDNTSKSFHKIDGKSVHIKSTNGTLKKLMPSQAVHIQTRQHGLGLIFPNLELISDCCTFSGPLVGPSEMSLMVIS